MTLDADIGKASEGVDKNNMNNVAEFDFWYIGTVKKKKKDCKPFWITKISKTFYEQLQEIVVDAKGVQCVCYFSSLLNEAITLFFFFNKQMTSTTFCELILCICL